jgi:hypothetical protein
MKVDLFLDGKKLTTTEIVNGTNLIIGDILSFDAEDDNHQFSIDYQIIGVLPRPRKSPLRYQVKLHQLSLLVAR